MDENKEVILSHLGGNTAVSKKSIYFPLWHQANIIWISDLFDTEKSSFPSFISLCQKFNRKFNFLFLSSIPSSWGKLNNSNELWNMSAPDQVSDSLTCKRISNKLLALEKLPSPTTEKKLLECGFKKDELRKVYLLSLSATEETKLIMFHYNIIHRILPTKKWAFVQGN